MQRKSAQNAEENPWLMMLSQSQSQHTLYFTASSQKYGYDKSLTCDGSECEVSEIEAYKPKNILISR